MTFKEQLASLGAFVVAVILIILYWTIDSKTIKGWFSSTRIVVASTTRGDVGVYLAGEVLKLSLEDVHSPRVFWIFDEVQSVTGSVEAQYAFPFDAQAPAGQARDRRIDAFFKSGDSYRTATTLVRTSNVNYTSTAGVEKSQFMVTAPHSFGPEWSLTGTSLARFSGGQFTKYRSWIPEPANDTAHFVATRKDALDAFGYGESTDLASALKSDERAWTWYDFKNKTTGASLTIAKPVAGQPQK